MVAVAGKVSSGVVVAADDHVEFAGVDAGIGQRGARGRQRQVGGLFAVACDMALADAGALADPFVGRIHLLGQIVIGDDVVRQIGAAADDAGADHGFTCRGTVLGADAGAVGGDAGIDVGLGHVDGHVQRAGKADRIGAAMAFHHHAAQAQKNAAIGGARIEPAAQRC